MMNTSDDYMIRSQDPRMVAARVFLGNLPSDKVSKEDLGMIYEKYGPLLGISIHRGFGFVQYKEPADAARAVQGEIGSMMHGVRVDVRLAMDKHKGAMGGAGARPLAMGLGAMPPLGAINPMQGNQGANSFGGLLMNNMPPARAQPQFDMNLWLGNTNNPSSLLGSAQTNTNGASAHILQSEINSSLYAAMNEARMNDLAPFSAVPTMHTNTNTSNMNTAQTHGQRRPAPDNVQMDRAAQHNYRRDQSPTNDFDHRAHSRERSPYNRADHRSATNGKEQQQHPGQHQHGHSHSANDRASPIESDRRSTTRERDITGTATGNAPARPAALDKHTDVGVERPYDAIVLVMDKSDRAYSEMVERRLMDVNLQVDVVHLIREDMKDKAIDALCRKGALYFLLIEAEHARNFQATVRVLHSVPVAVHRHMPLDDVLQLLSTDFANYLSALRSGSEQPSMSFLLHLLADGKHLSEPELQRIVNHLQQRALTHCAHKDKQVGADTGTVLHESPAPAPAPVAIVVSSTAVNNRPQTTITNATAAEPGVAKPGLTAQQTQEQLQQQILNILQEQKKPPSAVAVSASGQAVSQAQSVVTSYAQSNMQSHAQSVPVSSQPTTTTAAANQQSAAANIPPSGVEFDRALQSLMANREQLQQNLTGAGHVPAQAPAQQPMYAHNQHMAMQQQAQHAPQAFNNMNSMNNMNMMQQQQMEAMLRAQQQAPMPNPNYMMQQQQQHAELVAQAQGYRPAYQ